MPFWQFSRLDWGALLGVIHKLRLQNLALFDHLPPSVYIFCGMKVYKKSICLTTYPPPFVNVVYERAPAAPTAQNSPELHFHVINSFIHLSLEGSLGVTLGYRSFRLEDLSVSGDTFVLFRSDI